MNKQFTIFGHKGFLGKNIVHHLKRKKINFYLPPKNRYIFKKNLGNIIFCIGIDDIFKDPLKSLDANLKILCEILEKNNFKSFLFVSSTRVYYGNKDTREITNINVNSNNPTYLFNILKLASESLCLSKKNQKIKVVRLSNLYGNHFKNQIYLLPTLLRDSKKNKKIEIRINKNSKKNYLDVNDAIPLMLKIINKSKFRIYNIASNKRYSIKFILDNLKKNSKSRIIYENQKFRFDEPKINIERVKNEFGFKPSDKLQDFLNNKYL